MLLSNTTRLDKNCSNNSDGIVCQWRNEGLYSRQKQLQILLQKAIRLVNDRRNFLERENQQLDLVDGVIENTRTILYYLTNKSKENSQQINPSSHPLDDRMNDGILLSRGKMFDIPLKQTKIEIDENNIRMDESGYSSFYQQQTTKPKERGRDTKKLYVKQFSDKSSSVTDNSSISASNSSSSNSSMIFITSSSSLSSQLSPMKKDETKEKRKNIEHRQVKFQLPKGSNTKRRVKSSGNLKHVPLEKRERILNDPRKRINEKVIYDVITGCHGPNNCQPSNPALQTKYGSWKFEYFQRNIPSFNATDMYQLHTERKYCMENELKKETKTQLPLQYHHRTIRYSPKYHNNNIHQLEVMDEKNLSRRLSEHQNLNGKLTPKTKNFNAIQSTKKIIGKTNNRSRTNEQHSQIVITKENLENFNPFKGQILYDADNFVKEISKNTDYTEAYRRAFSSERPSKRSELSKGENSKETLPKSITLPLYNSSSNLSEKLYVNQPIKEKMTTNEKEPQIYLESKLQENVAVTTTTVTTSKAVDVKSSPTSVKNKKNDKITQNLYPGSKSNDFVNVVNTAIEDKNNLEKDGENGKVSVEKRSKKKRKLLRCSIQ